MSEFKTEHCLLGFGDCLVLQCFLDLHSCERHICNQLHSKENMFSMEMEFCLQNIVVKVPSTLKLADVLEFAT